MPPDPPQPQRRGIIVAVVIGIIGLVVVLGTSGGDLPISPRGGNPSTGAPTSTGSATGQGATESYSLTVAAQSVSDTTAVAYVRNLSGSDLEAITHARIDPTSKRSITETTLSGMTTTMIIDGETGITYLASDTLELGPTKWTSLTVGGLPGLDELVGDGSLMNPFDIARLFDKATSVTELGIEQINGRDLMHYEVNVAASTIETTLPTFSEDHDVAVSSDITFNVFVTANNELARISFDAESNLGSGRILTSVIDITASGTIEPIELPPANEVTPAGG